MSGVWRPTPGPVPGARAGSTTLRVGPQVRLEAIAQRGAQPGKRLPWHQQGHRDTDRGVPVAMRHVAMDDPVATRTTTWRLAPYAGIEIHSQLPPAAKSLPDDAHAISLEHFPLRIVPNR